MTQLTSHLEPFVKVIHPVNDASLIINPIRKRVAQSLPKPVLYHNYMVGPCNDLIFGVALADYATTHGLPDGAVPRIVDLCINEIEARGLDFEGLYRVGENRNFTLNLSSYSFRYLAECRMFRK